MRFEGERGVLRERGEVRRGEVRGGEVRGGTQTCGTNIS